MPSPHGTYSRYVNQRCRCVLCVAAKRAYARGQRRRRGPRATRCGFCGGPLPGPSPRGGKPRKWCSARCERLAAKPVCECGRPKTPRAARCTACAGVSISAAQRAMQAERHALIERLWASGRPMREIAAELGITPGTMGSSMNRWRALGLNLPYRYSLKRIENARAGWRAAS